MVDFKDVWITTVDNPYDPFTQWDQWYRYDEKNGYRTCGRLAKLARNAVDLSEEETEAQITAAIIALLDLYEPYEVYTLAIRGRAKQFGLSSST